MPQTPPSALNLSKNSESLDPAPRLNSGRNAGPGAQSRAARARAGLSVVATPIGNADDFSPNARFALEAADIIAAEDTRVFFERAKQFGLILKPDVKVFSYHDHNERESTPELIRLMQAGSRVALVSDAGTPNISDPGHHLLESCFQNQIAVVGIPGPCSLTLALSVCPLGGSSFSFHGFFPAHAAEAETLLKNLKGLIHRAVFFSSPHRLNQDLQILEQAYGPECKLFLGRELTKQFEEYLNFTTSEAITHFKIHPPKGEFVMIVAIPQAKAGLLNQEQLEIEIHARLKDGMTARDLRNHFTGMSELSRQQLYDLIEAIKKHFPKD